MAYSRPTLEQINARIQADLKAKLGSDASFVRRSWISIFGRVLAGAVHLLYGAIQYAVRQLFAVSADDESIVKKAALYGITRKPPAFAAGVARFRGVTGVTVPAGTVLIRSDNVRFETTQPVDISSATNTDTFIPVRAIEAGESGYTVVGQTLTLESPLGGVEDEVTVTTAFTGGADIESYESLRSRYLLRVQKPPQGGAKSDYEQWAKELPVVGHVTVYAPGDISITLGQPDYTPPVGEVWVYFSTPEGNAPPQEDIDTVQTYLNTKRPLTAIVRVRGIVNVGIQIKVGIRPATSSTYSIAVQDVKNALKDLMTDAALPNATIFKSQIDEAISRPSSERTHVLDIPTTDVQIGVNQIGKLDEAYFDANVYEY